MQALRRDSGSVTLEFGSIEEGITMSEKTLALSNDKMIAGVCGGIADYFGWSSGGVRLVYVLLSVLSAAFPGLFVYLILWLLMPRKDSL
jgi:phage shock protein C